jgi:hypothetical protein
MLYTSGKLRDMVIGPSKFLLLFRNSGQQHMKQCLEWGLNAPAKHWNSCSVGKLQGVAQTAADPMQVP